MFSLENYFLLLVILTLQSMWKTLNNNPLLLNISIFRKKTNVIWYWGHLKGFFSGLFVCSFIHPSSHPSNLFYPFHYWNQRIIIWPQHNRVYYNFNFVLWYNQTCFNNVKQMIGKFITTHKHFYYVMVYWNEIKFNFLSWYLSKTNWLLAPYP